MSIDANPANSHSVWLIGARAGNEGKGSHECPYPPSKYEFVVWHNGWANAIYNKTAALRKEEPRKPRQPVYDSDDL